MTHYRLNQPSAYGPVPGPPINPTNVIDILDALTEDEIRRRCVLYPKLVMFLEDVVGFAVNLRQTDPDWQDHQDVGLLYALAHTLLASTQET